MTGPRRRTTALAALFGLAGLACALPAGAATAAVSPSATASSSGAAAATSTSGTVVALWHMDEQPGATTMVDSSGYGHNGVIGNGVTLGQPGYLGTAYSFTGTGPGLVRVPTDTSLNPGSAPIAISAYLKVSSSLAAGDYNAVQKGTATATGGSYKLEVYGVSTSAKFGFPDCAFNSPGGKNRVYGPRSIADGTWHHVVCHLTATQAYVTVDDVSGKVASRTATTISNTSDVTVGGKPTQTHYLWGDLDEVSITIG